LIRWTPLLGGVLRFYLNFVQLSRATVDNA
jgi:hypothetical protein